MSAEDPQTVCWVLSPSPTTTGMFVFSLPPKTWVKGRLASHNTMSARWNNQPSLTQMAESTTRFMGSPGWSDWRLHSPSDMSHISLTTTLSDNHWGVWMHHLKTAYHSAKLNRKFAWYWKNGVCMRHLHSVWPMNQWKELWCWRACSTKRQVFGKNVTRFLRIKAWSDSVYKLRYYQSGSCKITSSYRSKRRILRPLFFILVLVCTACLLCDYCS